MTSLGRRESISCLGSSRDDMTGGTHMGGKWGKTERVGDFETLHSEFVEVGQ